ncbi:MAG: PD40 domain-containing protein [Saprospiraceae bacterium]|nr:PD40 domain-containing protein [Saprospiraceae bacterium]
MSLFRILLILAFALPATLFSQNLTTRKTASPRAVAFWKAGEEALQMGEQARAIREFERALEIDSMFIDAQIGWANAHYDARHWAEAERGYERAQHLAADYDPIVPFYLALAEWQQEKYAETSAHLDNFLASGVKNADLVSRATRLRDNARFAAEAVKRPVPFKPVSVGNGVNTPAHEFPPVLTADGETMIFTRNAGDNEDFYLSRRVNGQWQTAEAMTEVNTYLNEGAEALSADGSWLVFTGCNRRNDGSQGSCDLYWSQLKSTGWTKPAPFSAVINSPDWEAQPTISSDGKTLIFSSNRPGGQGGKDLWFTVRQSGGKWSAPQNFGAGINTPNDEEMPFFHPDGQTLYFVSNGLPGMGESDIYYVRRQPNGVWGKPENLGYPINTKSSEGGLTVSLDGRTAYFAANRPGGAGGYDIYQFDMPEQARPQAVTYVKAKVTDAATAYPIQAKVEITDLATGQLYQSVTTKTDGSFLACLPAGKDYALAVSKEKYLFHSENFNLLETATFEKPFLLNIALQPIPALAEDGTLSAPAGKPVVLRNVFFETGSAELRPESAAELDRLAALLAETPGLRIQISGHTDHVGDDRSNLTLSENRAKAVYNYLIAKGIAAQRLRFKGFGESQPVAPNDTDEGRAQNRRTEFVVW